MYEPRPQAESWSRVFAQVSAEQEAAPTLPACLPECLFSRLRLRRFELAGQQQLFLSENQSVYTTSWFQRKVKKCMFRAFGLGMMEQTAEVPSLREEKQ